VESGGNLIVTGTSGMRSGEDGNFGRRESSSLSALTGINEPARTHKDTSRELGRGNVHYLAQPIGLDFFKADEDCVNMLNRFDAVIGDRAEFLFSDVENIPTSVGLVAYSDGEAGCFFVDVSNTNIDVNADEITSSLPISFSINLPDTWTGRNANIRTICPDSDVLAEIIRRERRRITIELPSVRLYACLIISRF
jgi:hypothetical protein